RHDTCQIHDWGVILKELSTVLISAAAVALVAVAAASAAGGYSLFGNAGIVSPGEASGRAAQASSIGAPGYGGVDFAVPTGLTVSQLNNLATDYNFTAG